MADITRLGEIAMPKLSDNMAPEDRRSINNYLMQLRDQMMYMMQNLDETNFSDTMRDKLVAMGLKVELLAAPPKVELCLEECEDERRQ